MTRAQLAGAVRRYLGQPGTEFISDTQINGALNQAMDEINQICEFKRTPDPSIALMTGQIEYTIPSIVSTIYQVRYGSSRKKLTSTSRSELFDSNPSWESAATGTPTKYYTDGMQLGVVPGPDAGAAATVLYLRALSDPSQLTNATTVPSWLPNGFHDAIALGAALEIVQGYDAEAAANVRIEGLYARYQGRLKAIAALASHRAREYAPRIKVTGYASMGNK